MDTLTVNNYGPMQPISHGFRKFQSCQKWMSFLWMLLILMQLVVWAPIDVQGIRWLGIYRLPRSADHPPDTTADRFTNAECHKASTELGLRRRQSRFCSHPRLGFAMLAVLRAAHAVGYHCPKAFADRRWNCTSIHQLPDISPELRRGTREQALVHAFASAALLFEIGRYCALNKIRFCSCGDENMAHAIGDFTSQNGLSGQSGYISQDGALVYEAGSDSNGLVSSVNPISSNTNTAPDGQPTVSRFYWAGCSDNLRIAREYTSAFLGFPNVRLTTLPTSEIEKNDEVENMVDSKLHRFIRSMKITFEDENDLKQPLEFGIPIHPDRVSRELSYPWPYSYSFGTNGQPMRLPQPSQNSQRLYPYSSSARLNNRSPVDSDRRWPRRPILHRRRRRSQINRIMSRHNYLAGVVLMEANHKLVCKCHGVSGSCAQRVCFRQLRRIDDELMQKALKTRYLAAKHVTVGNNRQLIAKTFTGTGFMDEVVKRSELVFSEHSPDYCNVEPQRGSVGTHGRTCTLTDAGTANCLNMCCGRGYKNVTTKDIVQCNCRMGEGFKVQCDDCHVEVVTQQCL